MADGAANPYLLQAACLAGGINGMEKKIPSGKRLDIDMYAEADKVKNAPRLPANLLMRCAPWKKTPSSRIGWVKNGWALISSSNMRNGILLWRIFRAGSVKMHLMSNV